MENQQYNLNDLIVFPSLCSNIIYLITFSRILIALS